MALVNQPNQLPTRKLVAIIISGAILGGLQSALSVFWPDHPFASVMEDLDIWVQGFVMVLVGYLTRSNENVVVEKASIVQRTDSSGDSQLSFSFVRQGEEETGEVGSGEQAPERKGDTT